jgi:hypothetical protein
MAIVKYEAEKLATPKLVRHDESKRASTLLP